jgi:hypothetical protein
MATYRNNAMRGRRVCAQREEKQQMPQTEKIVVDIPAVLSPALLAGALDA